MPSAICSGFYSLINKGLSIGLNIVGLAVLGRLLSPQEFGVFGIIVATEALFRPMLDMGLTPAFIKLDSATRDASNAFFSVNVLLGLIVTLCLVCLSPVLAYVYDEKQLLYLTLVFALSIMIRSLSRQPVACLAREKRFDKILIIEQSALVAGLFTVTITAWIGFGVWALILRAIVQGLILVSVSHLITTNKYTFVGLSVIKKYKENFRLGCEIVAGRFVGGLNNSIDKLLFGKFFSISLLGHYNRAFRLAIIPDANIRMALTTPALAHLARIDNSNSKQWGNYVLMCNIVMLLAGLPCVVFIVLGDKLLPWLMGEQWVTGGIFLQLLGVWCLGKILHGLCAIIHINELYTKRWITINMISVPVIFLAPISSYFITGKAFYFILSLSLSNIVFWSIILAWILKKYTLTFQVPIQTLRTLTIMTTASLLFLTVKKLFAEDFFQFSSLETVNIITSSSVVVLGTVLLQLLLNYGQINDLYKFVRKKTLLRKEI